MEAWKLSLQMQKTKNERRIEEQTKREFYRTSRTNHKGEYKATNSREKQERRQEGKRRGSNAKKGKC